MGYSFEIVLYIQNGFQSTEIHFPVSVFYFAFACNNILLGIVFYGISLKFANFSKIFYINSW